MLRKVQKLKEFDISATDGEIGKVDSFYFDEDRWTVRYLVVDTGGWLSSRKVLISPAVLGQPVWETKTLSVALTKEQVKNSPEIDTSEPISRQQEIELQRFYNWPPYWTGIQPTSERTFVAGSGGSVTATMVSERSHFIRNTDEVIGYHIQATDGEIGHVEDFFVADNSWDIHYLEVDTRNWLPGKKVLIAPRWVERFDWDESDVYLNLSRQQVEDSPEYKPVGPIDRGYETRLHDYYGFPYYWI